MENRPTKFEKAILINNSKLQLHYYNNIYCGLNIVANTCGRQNSCINCKCFNNELYEKDENILKNGNSNI